MTATTRPSGHRLTRSTLRGTWAPVLLPINTDDSIDFARLAASLDVLLPTAGLAGVYTNGTASEFHTLDENEYDRLHALVADRCAPAGVAYQLGASHPSGQLSLDRVRRAVAYEPAAVQVILPDWLPLTDDEAIDAVARMAAVAGDVPLVLYNPPHAKTQLRAGLLGRLVRTVPTLIGIKVASADGDMLAAADDVAVFVAGHTLASGRRAGANGSYSNVACLSPAGAVRWEGLMDTDPGAAGEIERRLRSFLATHVAPLGRAGYANPALDKALTWLGGWADIGTRVRWPHRSVPPETLAPLVSVVRREVPELFSDVTDAPTTSTGVADG